MNRRDFGFAFGGAMFGAAANHYYREGLGKAIPDREPASTTEFPSPNSTVPVDQETSKGEWYGGGKIAPVESNRSDNETRASLEAKRRKILDSMHTNDGSQDHVRELTSEENQELERIDRLLRQLPK